LLRAYTSRGGGDIYVLRAVLWSPPTVAFHRCVIVFFAIMNKTGFLLGPNPNLNLATDKKSRVSHSDSDFFHLIAKSPNHQTYKKLVIRRFSDEMEKARIGMTDSTFFICREVEVRIRSE